MSTLLVKPLNLKNNSNLFQLNNLENKQNSLSEINDVILEQIFGGRLPNGNELAIILALRNTEPSRLLTGAILDNKSIFLNIGIFAPGSSGNISNQING